METEYLIDIASCVLRGQTHTQGAFYLEVKMKVIKHGRKKDKKPDVTFTCKKCGCVFIAEWGEYTRHYGQIQGGTYYEVHCPECNGIVGEEMYYR